MLKMPHYDELFIPYLTVLNGEQHSAPYKEIAIKVRDRFFNHLPPEILQLKNKSGNNSLLNRISFVKSELKQAGYARYPQRGYVVITDKGKKALQRGALTTKEVYNEPEYLKYKESVVQAKAKQEKSDKIDANITPDEKIDVAITAYENTVKLDLLEAVQALSPRAFEKLVLDVLESMGYGKAESTPYSRDGGIDGILNQDALGLNKVYVQSKHHANNIAAPDIQKFIGAMRHTRSGVFVTTSDFSSGAKEEARVSGKNLALINGENLVSLMYEHGIGVVEENPFVVKNINNDYFDEIDPASGS